MYDKPKVTIDMDEYLALKECIQLYRQEDLIQMYETTINAVHIFRSSPNELREYLESEGIEVIEMPYIANLQDRKFIVKRLKKEPQP